MSTFGGNDLTKSPGDTPAHWLTWFQVDDADASLAKAAELGIDQSRTVGEPLAPA